MRLAVLASGAGTILGAMLEERLPVDLVVVDRECAAVDVAGDAGVAVEQHIRRSYGDDFDRSRYTEELVATLGDRGIELIAMAGFGTIFSSQMFTAFEGRILNTHPSLLPSFPGWHAVRDALEYGVKVTGCTVHVATEEVDAGPILAQRAVEVLPGDTEASLHDRIKAVERPLYLETIRRVLQEGVVG